MPYWLYKLVHVAGFVWVFAALGALAVHSLNGGTKQSNQVRKLLAVSHGVGMLLVLVGGFGMLARLGIVADWPGWVIAKMVLWLIAGALVSIPYRKPNLSKPLWFVLPVLAVLAGWIANLKPF